MLKGFSEIGKIVAKLGSLLMERQQEIDKAMRQQRGTGGATGKCGEIGTSGGVDVESRQDGLLGEVGVGFEATIKELVRRILGQEIGHGFPFDEMET